MILDRIYEVISRRPGWVAIAWLVAAVAITLTAPGLTELVSRQQAELLPPSAESRRASDLARATWPDQEASSLVVVGLNRPGGLTDEDHAYARRLADLFGGEEMPEGLLGVLGPGSRPEVARHLVSRDGAVQMVVGRLATSFVDPAGGEVIHRLKALMAEMPPPGGLRVLWSGDAVLGDRFMQDIKTTLDRAAIATVFLIMLVLMLVYRSAWLALIPLATIGVSLLIARGVLAWMVLAGWEASIMVELFLVVILFGSGTDLCLFLTWRFAEQWQDDDPVEAMRRTLHSSLEAILTGAGTVIVGLSLMRTTTFKMFSTTGPSVALGLALSVCAVLTLTPSLLLMVARRRPRAFAGLKAPSSGFWERVGRGVLSRPAVLWIAMVAAMAGPAYVGLHSGTIHNILAELPRRSEAVQDTAFLADAFNPGVLAPLTVVIESDQDLRRPRGLALIDDLSRSLMAQGGLAEVRSATQPDGDPATLDRARIASRLVEVEDGLARLTTGSEQLQGGLNQGLVKLRVGNQLTRLFNRGEDQPKSIPPEVAKQMADELAVAANSAGEIADGTRRSREALAAILDDPAGRELVDRLLLTEKDLDEHPELREALTLYLSEDGRKARIDLAPSEPMFSAEAIDRVGTIRRHLAEKLSDAPGGIRAHALTRGINAEWADIRTQTTADQWRIWWVVPLGVSIILLFALRNIGATANLIATMILSYLFALGVTHLVFVTLLGAPGLDWKVPYFLFILLVAVGVDYNVFLMTRLREEARIAGLREGIIRAIGRTGGLISSAAAITACSFAALMLSPLASLRQFGFALVVGIIIDALLVRPVLVPSGHWLLNQLRQDDHPRPAPEVAQSVPPGQLPVQSGL